MAIQRRAMKDSVGAMLNPGAPKYTRDHAAENRARLRELEAVAQQRRQIQELESEGAPLYKMSQFQNVPSRLAQSGLGHAVKSPSKDKDADSRPASKENTRSGTAASGGSGSPSKQFLRKKPTENPTSKLPSAFVRAEALPRKAAVPRATETAQLAPREQRNYLSANVVHAITAAPRVVAHEADSVPARSLPAGEVPGYLQQRTARWAAEAEAKAAAEKAAAECPPGHRLMPESERVETLALLRANIAEAQDALTKLPFRIDGPTATKKRGDLEAKLKKMEDALTVFNKPKVYVRIDA